MTLTAAERVTYQTRLSEAETAMHQLQLGQQARVFVDQNGERVEFNLNSVASLRAYIMELRIGLGLPTGIVGPMRPWML